MAKAISAKLLELNLKNNLEETGEKMKQEETGRNRKNLKKKTGRNWMILKETGKNRKKQEESGKTGEKKHTVRKSKKQ